MLGNREKRITVECAIGQTGAAGRALQLATGGFRQRPGIEQRNNGGGFLKSLGDGFPDGLDQGVWWQNFLHAAADFCGNTNTVHAIFSYGKRGDAAFAYHIDFALDGLLDVLRVEIMATHDQHILQAAGDEQLTMAQETQVAGAQPGATVTLHKGPGAGFRVAPIAVSDARPGGPDFTYLIVGLQFTAERIDDAHPMLRLTATATHQNTAHARFGAMLCKGLITHFQIGDAMPTLPASDKQRGFSQAITGEETVGCKTCRCEFAAEQIEAVLANRLGAGKRHAPFAQVELVQSRITDPLAAQPVGKIRPATDGAAVLTDRLQPAQRTAEEITRRHQHTRHTAEDRLQQTADQAHVVVQRQPADDHIVRIEIDAEAAADQQLVGHQIAVADLHAFGQRCGA